MRACAPSPRFSWCSQRGPRPLGKVLPYCLLCLPGPPYPPLFLHLTPSPLFPPSLSLSLGVQWGTQIQPRVPPSPRGHPGSLFPVGGRAPSVGWGRDSRWRWEDPDAAPELGEGDPHGGGPHEGPAGEGGIWLCHEFLLQAQRRPGAALAALWAMGVHRLTIS